MLFEAAFWRPGSAPPTLEEGLSQPALANLLKAWGRHGDAAVIAESAARLPLGAAWYRLWSDRTHSYGYISAGIPELAIAVAAGHRGRGIGSRLLRELKATAARQGFEWLSLSVERDNRALHLYERHDFVRVRLAGNAWTMRARV
jgi:ribosomal-protein-alanine N-acetyltransferase